MGTVPQAYYDFIMHYAPYFYVIPTSLTADATLGQRNLTVADGTKFQSGYPVQISDDISNEWNTVSSVDGNVVTVQNNLANTYYAAKSGKVEGPDPAYGRGVFPAAFAIDFLFQAYSSTQFSTNQPEILAKIKSLADFILTQQCTDGSRNAHGGFQNNESNQQYWSIDAGRCIPALLEAYDLTGTTDYLSAAILAGHTFLDNMRTLPVFLGVHDRYYGGFARYVDINNNWSQQIDVENLYCLIGLEMLARTYDPSHVPTYKVMIRDLVDLLQNGFELFFLWLDPKPIGDGYWHRAGLEETQVYDDPISFALLGLYTYEGWSSTCQDVYRFMQSIRPSAQYPAYNPAVCWPGYIDVIERFPACAYYDALTSGILWKIRARHDQPSLALSMQVINNHQSQFMFWGPRFADYSAITLQKAMANVAWLAQFFLNYRDPITDFTKLLDLSAENLILYPIQQAADQVTWGQALSIRSVVTVGASCEIVFEPGYITEDHITVLSFLPMRVHDKIRRSGVDYEVLTVQVFEFSGDPFYFKSTCRKLITQ